MEGNFPILSFVVISGERGKQLVPGNKGALDIKSAFSFYILKSSPKIHPTDHMSTAFV